jgi:hypothetical protein
VSAPGTATIEVTLPAANSKRVRAGRGAAGAAAGSGSSSSGGGAAGKAGGAKGDPPICTVEVEFSRTMVLRQGGVQQQQQQGDYWRPFGPKPGWFLGCVAVNTFTGVTEQVPLPPIVVDTASPAR